MRGQPQQLRCSSLYLRFHSTYPRLGCIRLRLRRLPAGYDGVLGVQRWEGDVHQFDLLWLNTLPPTCATDHPVNYLTKVVGAENKLNVLAERNTRPHLVNRVLAANSTTRHAPWNQTDRAVPHINLRVNDIARFGKIEPALELLNTAYPTRFYGAIKVNGEKLWCLSRIGDWIDLDLFS